MMDIVERENIISIAQGGFRWEMSMTTQIHALRGVMEEVNYMNKQLHIMYIDIAGAYDSVLLERMYETLIVYGFPLSLVNLIKNMYMDNTVSIFTDYGKTDPIHVTQGVRQGDPLLPLLFNIFINPIIEKLHQNESRYQMESGSIIGAIAFTDDIAILSETVDGMNKLWTELSKFC
jgi:hypothetical protein